MAAAKSKSQRMRELAAAGMSRADIARKLSVRYQFVRNVLEKERERVENERKLSGGFSDQPQAEFAELSAKLKVGPDGRVVIPAAFREALGLGEGDTLFARLENGEIHLLTAKAVMRRVNSMVRRFVPEGVSLVDELLEDRRREVEREKENG